MPRQPRQIYDGGYYHIVTRGNDGKVLFRVNADFEYFKTLVREEMSGRGVCIHNYCLMKNHVHLLLNAVKAGDTPVFIKYLLQRYARYFGKQYEHKGYLFQNRYKSIAIDKDSYLLECARYIERNPVRAGIAAVADEYPWSSCSHYTKGRDDDIVAKDNPAYIWLSDDASERRRLNKIYLEEDRPYEHLVAQGLGMR
jgi:putative transposase